MMLGRKRKRAPQPQIDVQLARVLASQVAAGLMRNAEPEGLRAVGDQSEAWGSAQEWAAECEVSAVRARSALAAIGLMVRNASGGDAQVQANLDAADQYVVRQTPHGTRISGA